MATKDLDFLFQKKKIWWKTSSKKDLLRRVYGDSYISFEDKSYLLHRLLNRKTWFLQRKDSLKDFDDFLLKERLGVLKDLLWSEVITQKDLVFSSTKDCDSNSERLDDLMKDSLGDDSKNIDERLFFSSTKDFFTSERLDDLMKDLIWRGLQKT